ncbi:MAG: ECF transporter S component [Candidatus Izimaplasma sp.]|nr:ECF transporter S component [Candidatus Izimaplasma bacterium]
MNTRKITYTALFVAIGIVLPQAIHLLGGPGLGAILLPMHLPVFIGAMLLGPIAGLIIAIISVSVGIMLGMPPLLIGIYMLFELGIYGLVSGYLYKVKNFNLITSYLIAKISGMAVSLIIINLMIRFFGATFPAVFGSIGMFLSGVPGIVMQVILIPILIVTLEKYQRDLI